MRMQLVTILIILLPICLYAQDKKSLPPTEIDILSSYYEQDGDSSAVTGGQGTEKLDDIASKIVINIPVDHKKTFKLETGFSYFTSASSDNIDPKTISSASHEALVLKLNGEYTVRDTSNRNSKGFNFRFHHQPNFGSLGFGAFYTRMSKDKDREVTINSGFNLDKWALYYDLKKLYPREIRYSAQPLPTDKRNSLDLSVSLKQIINERMQALLSSGITYQWGLLSTPFHRVYFEEEEMPDLERLPGRRIRIPIVGRFNYYASDYLIIRSFYRYYIDNFGLSAHTINIETPVKITNFISIYPYGRFYTQNGSRYFSSYKTHHKDEEYYTSDFDLSDFNSYMVGGGIRISPPLGLAKFKISSKKPPYTFKEIELRFARYWRTNGLDASIFSFKMGFLH